MKYRQKKSESFDFVGAFEQGWVQYRSNLPRLIPYGFLASLPPLLFLHSILMGAAAVLFLEGFFLLFLVDTIVVCNNSENPDLLRRFVENWRGYLKNGFIISCFVFPLLTMGFVAFVIPSILLFSIFIFSFTHVVVKHKFAIDACMESLRQGYGYRLHLFLLSFFFYAAIALIYLITDFHPALFIVISTFFLPYFFAVVQEFFEQLEIK